VGISKIKFAKIVIGGISGVSVSLLTSSLVSIPRSTNIDSDNSSVKISKRPTKGNVPATRRDPSCPAIPVGMPDITPLTPALTPSDKSEDSVIVTLSQSPTFRFYSPYSKGMYRFRLLPENKDVSKALYRQDIPIASTGIFTVSLPVIKSLKAKENYFWELEYLCTKDPKATNPMVFGYLYRDQLTASQKQQFSRANTSAQRIDFYRKNDLWVELLDEIAKSYPQSKTIWQQTLDAEELQSISKEPLLLIK
jgi:Domain of Unknown Function (DUF928)